METDKSFQNGIFAVLVPEEHRFQFLLDDQGVESLEVDNVEAMPEVIFAVFVPSEHRFQFLSDDLDAKNWKVITTKGQHLITRGLTKTAAIELANKINALPVE